jgi:NAD-dependent deacetylase
MNSNRLIQEAADLIFRSKSIVAFTGAGISAESGIPPFRGEGGLWNRYDPVILELGYFISRPAESWEAIRTIFYDFFSKVKPNQAHLVLADWERSGKLNSIITQNIDNLHTLAGSREVYEFHGNSERLICLDCFAHYSISEIDLGILPPLCPSCFGLLKPDFVFFGEGIPPLAYQKSVEAASGCDLMLIIGTSGEVAPANQLPRLTRSNRGKIIEINLSPSSYTNTVTDLFIPGKASEVLSILDQTIKNT